MNSYILFRNPKVKYRKEEYGGIVKTREGMFIIDKKTFKILETINGAKTYSEIAVDKETKKIVDDLLKLSIILPIKKKVVEKIKQKLNNL